MEPQAAPSCTDHVTFWLLDPVTVAMNACVPSAGRLSTFFGEMVTEKADCGGEGGRGGAAAWPPPHPAAPVTNAKAIPTLRSFVIPSGTELWLTFIRASSASLALTAPRLRWAILGMRRRSPVLLLRQGFNCHARGVEIAS